MNKNPHHPGFDYQQDQRFFAQTALQLELLAVDEIRELGGKSVRPGRAGVYFQANPATLYRINYCARLISRILAPLSHFECSAPENIYQAGIEFPWENFITTDTTFAVFSTVKQSPISHSQYAALKLKDAIVDRFRRFSPQRPTVDREHPDVAIHLHVESTHASLSLDTSGMPLGRRGYRRYPVEAPLQETLAAAIIRLSAWNGEQPLVDPMCGSGTLLAEALMSYCHVPAQVLRNNFGFFNLPDFSPDIWLKVREECQSQIRALPAGLISGLDIDPMAIQKARKNLTVLPYGDNIQLQQGDFRTQPGWQETTIVCNPPYAIRTGDLTETQRLYKELGDFLKRQCRNSRAFILCGNRELIKSIGLRPRRKIPLYNGQLESRLIDLNLY